MKLGNHVEQTFMAWRPNKRTFSDKINKYYFHKTISPKIKPEHLAAIAHSLNSLLADEVQVMIHL
ncbi:uncharacterized membrane protein YbaN (DUF454 family) [Pedobacter sp. CG_S7]|uniref:hypothetical protein n=1 Tax=Pedobacter sp. CG_S7 TaxID=3143930 RepID=UPI00339546A4